MSDQPGTDDESNADRYYRGFNDGCEYARRQAEVERPRPDWSVAPDGANWWAVDPDGYCHWFENKPILEAVTSAPDVIGPRWSHHGSKWIRYEAVNIPLGIDWRTLVECRPEAQDNARYFGEDHLDTVQLYALMSELRDEYEKRIAELEAEIDDISQYVAGG